MGDSESYWSKDGWELFYVAAYRNLMMVPIKHRSSNKTQGELLPLWSGGGPVLDDDDVGRT